MSTQTTPTIAPQTAPARTILLPCPCCHEQQATVSLCLADGDWLCHECEEHFDADAVREMIEQTRRWEKVLAWADMLPTAE